MPTKRVVVIGANAAGASVAARLRRLDENIEIILLDRGNYMSFANCGLPYYLGNTIDDIDKINGNDSIKFSELNNIDTRLQTELLKVSPEDNKVLVRDLAKESDYEIEYDDLVLALGANLFIPPIPNIEKVNFHKVLRVEDVELINHEIESKKIKSCLIIGTGYIGLEVAEQLIQRGLDITMHSIETQILDQIDFEMARPIQEKAEAQGIKFILNDGISDIKINNLDSSIEVSFKSSEKISTDLIILATGVRPNINIAKEAGLEISKVNAIKVNHKLQSSIKNIWAAGDCVSLAHFIDGDESNIALAGPANRQGRIIADNILGADIKIAGNLGTAILKFFDLNIALLGRNEKYLKKQNLDYEVIYIHYKQHTGYYPGTKPIHVKVIYDKNSLKILGAQILGYDGVDKRIDVLSTAVFAGLKVYELDDIELAYAPPFNSAKDALNLAGLVASNVIDGTLEQIQYYDLQKNNFDSIIDLRSKEDFEKSHIPEATNLEYRDHRTAVKNLDKNKNYLLYDNTGSKSYTVSCYMKNLGFKEVKTLAGGFFTYRYGMILGKQKEKVNA